jgi:DNA-binding response OmpR family regulator
VVVVTPSLVAGDVDQDTVATLLKALGHDVQCFSYPSFEFEHQDAPRDAALLLGGPRLDIMRAAIASLRAHPVLRSTRILAGVDLAVITTLQPENGPDDFILMPINATEVSARLEHLVARDQKTSHRAVTECGGICLDREARDALQGDRFLGLTPYEFQLLLFLVERPGRAFSREELLMRVFNCRVVSRVATINRHINNLRSKLGPMKDIVKTVRNFGFKLERPGAVAGGDYAVVNPWLPRTVPPTPEL